MTEVEVRFRSEGRANDELSAYENAWRATDIGKDLKRVRKDLGKLIR